MAFIEIQNITHRYQGGAKALDDVSYSIEKGSFFSLLGPSGCGKTTLLNIVGGFVPPSEGRVLIDGEDVTDLPPYRRKIGMVFQDYALFPHLSVFENVAYGLRVQKRAKSEIARRVADCLELVHLDGLEKRMPHQLSGGQQQRVAIARALAIEPAILMLDEPLGNLDAKLRKEMQVELRRIQRSTGVTTVMVTHDQEEAMTMSDGIGIMNKGRVQQIGSPFEVYEHPRNSFVAGFLGKANMSETILAADGCRESTSWFGRDGAPLRFASGQASDVGTVVCIRPEKIRLAFESREGAVPANLRDIVYAGSIIQAFADLQGGGSLELEIGASTVASIPVSGQEVYVSWADEAAILVENTDGALPEGEV